MPNFNDPKLTGCAVVDWSATKTLQVTPSCGCVFCDIGLEPTWVEDKRLHCGPRGTFECTNPVA